MLGEQIIVEVEIDLAFVLCNRLDAIAIEIDNQRIGIKGPADRFCGAHLSRKQHKQRVEGGEQIGFNIGCCCYHRRRQNCCGPCQLSEDRIAFLEHHVHRARRHAPFAQFIAEIKLFVTPIARREVKILDHHDTAEVERSIAVGIFNVKDAGPAGHGTEETVEDIADEQVVTVHFVRKERHQVVEIDFVTGFKRGVVEGAGDGRNDCKTAGTRSQHESDDRRCGIASGHRYPVVTKIIMVLGIHDLGIRKIPEHIGVLSRISRNLTFRADATPVVPPAFSVLRSVDDEVATYSTDRD